MGRCVFAPLERCDFVTRVPDVRAKFRKDWEAMGRTFGLEVRDGMIYPMSVEPEHVREWAREAVTELVGIMCEADASRRSLASGIDFATGRPWGKSHASKARRDGCEGRARTEEQELEECVGVWWDAFGADVAKRLIAIAREEFVGLAGEVMNVDRKGQAVMELAG